MNTTKRNEPCPCGSGKKYKKCCINQPLKFASNEMMNNMEELIGNNEKKNEITKVCSTLIEIVNRLNWEGSCHSISSIMYILFKELGLNTELCIGEVRDNKIAFDHSWVEVDGNVYDISIFKPLDNKFIYEPTINGCNLKTKDKCSLEYGGDRIYNLDYDAMRIQQVSFLNYMNGLRLECLFSPVEIYKIKDIYDSNEEGLWGFVSAIAKAIDMECDISVLKEKYKDTIRTSK